MESHAETRRGAKKVQRSLTKSLEELSHGPLQDEGPSETAHMTLYSSGDEPASALGTPFPPTRPADPLEVHAELYSLRVQRDELLDDLERICLANQITPKRAKKVQGTERWLRQLAGLQERAADAEQYASQLLAKLMEVTSQLTAKDRHAKELGRLLRELQREHEDAKRSAKHYMSEASEALKLKDVFATENAALSSTVERLEAQKRDLRAQTSEQRDQLQDSVRRLSAELSRAKHDAAGASDQLKLERFRADAVLSEQVDLSAKLAEELPALRETVSQLTQCLHRATQEKVTYAQRTAALEQQHVEEQRRTTTLVENLRHLLAVKSSEVSALQATCSELRGDTESVAENRTPQSRPAEGRQAVGAAPSPSTSSDATAVSLSLSHLDAIVSFGEQLVGSVTASGSASDCSSPVEQLSAFRDRLETLCPPVVPEGADGAVLLDVRDVLALEAGTRTLGSMVLRVAGALIEARGGSQGAHASGKGELRAGREERAEDVAGSVQGGLVEDEGTGIHGEI